MSNVTCEACGHAFKAIRCRCKGYIVNAESWKLGRWDWRWLFGAFGNGISTMDVDALVERRGRFLILEAKGPGVPVPSGQMRALQELARDPMHTVAVVHGAPDEPQFMQVITPDGPAEKAPASRDVVFDWANQWWKSVANLRSREYAGDDPCPTCGRYAR